MMMFLANDDVWYQSRLIVSHLGDLKDELKVWYQVYLYSSG